MGTGVAGGASRNRDHCQYHRRGSGGAPGGATDSVRRDIIVQEQPVKRDLQRMSRERLLPDEKTLEKVGRYEAHLSRGLYKAPHEQETLQMRRTGGAARLDVDRLVGS
jgi:hypothetical protein